MRKISGYETKHHPYPGDLAYETVKVQGIEFVIADKSSYEYNDSRFAEFAMNKAKEHEGPVITVIQDHHGKENYAIVNSTIDATEVHNDILAAWSNGNGNPRNQDLDVVVSDYLAAAGIRWSGPHQGSRGRS